MEDKEGREGKGNGKTKEFKEDKYYTTAGRKVGDFFIGFGGMIGISLIFSVMFGILVYGRGNNPLYLTSVIDDSLSFLSIIISLALAIGGIRYFKKKGRRFISKGILWFLILTVGIPLLIVLLIFGACFFGGGGGFLG